MLGIRFREFCIRTLEFALNLTGDSSRSKSSTGSTEMPLPHRLLVISFRDDSKLNKLPDCVAASNEAVHIQWETLDEDFVQHEALRCCACLLHYAFILGTDDENVHIISPLHLLLKEFKFFHLIFESAFYMKLAGVVIASLVSNL